MDNVTAEYAKAYETMNAATRVYAEAQKAYRARLIGDTEYLAARAVYEAAEKAYDVAYAKEAQS